MSTGADHTFYVIRPVHGRANEKSRQFFLGVKSTQLRCLLTSREKRCAFSRIDFICAEFYGTEHSTAQQPTPATPVGGERGNFILALSLSLSLSLSLFSPSHHFTSVPHPRFFFPSF